MKNEGKCADEISMELYNYLFSLVWIQIRYNMQKTFLSIFDLSIPKSLSNTASTNTFDLTGTLKWL